MEGGTEFDLKAIDADNETNKKQLSTSSDKQPNNGWFSAICVICYMCYMLSVCITI